VRDVLRINDIRRIEVDHRNIRSDRDRVQPIRIENPKTTQRGRFQKRKTLARKFENPSIDSLPNQIPVGVPAKWNLVRRGGRLNVLESRSEVVSDQWK
jgi:hypothetical protein